MKRLLIALAVLFLLLDLSAQAQQVADARLPEADRAAIRQVIRLQLAALQRDDAELAFSYASPMIQFHFGTPDNFLYMVKTAYPPVYRPRQVEFQELESTWEGPVQAVFFFGADGKPVVAFYYMQRQDDGNWKINGCEIRDAPGVGI